MKRLVSIIIFAAISPLGWSQVAIPISGIVISQYGQPVPGAQVRVCLVTSTGVPCVPTVSLFQDYGMTLPASNPYIADSQGNYTVYGPAIASPGLYLVQVSPQAGTTYSYVVNGNNAVNPVSGCNFAVVGGLGNITCTGTGTFGTVEAGTVEAGTTVIASGQGVWKRRGVVQYTPVGYSTSGAPSEEPSVLQDGSPHILAGINPVWKKWWSCGIKMCYSESPDGIVWTTQTNPVVIGSCFRSSVFEPTAGSFIAFCTAPSGTNQVDEYTSSDGITWTDTYPAVLPAGSPSWTQTTLTNNSQHLCVSGETGCTVGTLYLYNEIEGVGLALYTSTDMHTFTPVSIVVPNPTYQWYQGPSVPYLVNGTWYMWVHGTGSGLFSSSSVISRISAPTLAGPWTYDVESMVPRTLDEGAGTPYAQAADPYVIQTPDGAKTYMYYTASQYIAGNWYQQTKLAIFDGPISSLVKTNEGDSAVIDNSDVLGLTFDYLNGDLNTNGRTIEFGNGSGTFSWDGNMHIDSGASGTTFMSGNGFSGTIVGFRSGLGTQALGSIAANGSTNLGVLFGPLGGPNESIKGDSANLNIDAAVTGGEVLISGASGTGQIAAFKTGPSGPVVAIILNSGIPVIPALAAVSGYYTLCSDTKGDFVANEYGCGTSLVIPTTDYLYFGGTTGDFLSGDGTNVNLSAVQTNGEVVLTGHSTSSGAAVIINTSNGGATLDFFDAFGDFTATAAITAGSGSKIVDRCQGGSNDGAIVVASSTQATACTTGGGTLYDTDYRSP